MKLRKHILMKGYLKNPIWDNDLKISMDLSSSCPLPNFRNISIPYMLVSHAAFQFTEYMLRPYPVNQLNRNRRIFNYRLSRAKRISKNAFLFLVNIWRYMYR